MAQDADKHAVAALMLRVEGGKVLREALAQPLLVVVAPANGLAEPLMRDFVRDEEVWKPVERRGVITPDERRKRQRLNNLGEVRRAVSSREVAFGDRDGERGVRQVAGE